MEASVKSVFIVGKEETMKLLKSLDSWQMEALSKAESAKSEEELREAIEGMGMSQGIINSLNILKLFIEEERQAAVKRQQDIAEAIKKSAKRLADRQAQRKTSIQGYFSL